MTLSPYSWLMLGGIGVSLVFWRRLIRRDSRPYAIYLAALSGAFLGAKVVYFCAEGYRFWGAPDFWLQLATGKSILGGLLGGYAAVELTKAGLGYRAVTGDWFAQVAPVGILLGRLGCWAHGCCRGIACPAAWYTLRDAAGQARWPAVPVEIAFNLLALGAIFWLHKTRRLPGQHFHLYLIAYGAFRFIHEFLRDEPRLLGPVTGYQVAALVVLGLGVGGFIRRGRRNALTSPSTGHTPSAPPAWFGQRR